MYMMQAGPCHGDSALSVGDRAQSKAEKVTECLTLGGRGHIHVQSVFNTQFNSYSVDYWP